MEHKQTKAEAKESGKNGGLKSAETRRRKREEKELLELLKRGKKHNEEKTKSENT